MLESFIKVIDQMVFNLKLAIGEKKLFILGLEFDYSGELNKYGEATGHGIASCVLNSDV